MSDASAAGLRVESARPHMALVTLDRPQVMNAIEEAAYEATRRTQDHHEGARRAGRAYRA
jgi:enoyl-CoA hydratase/carnithine racemase